MNTGHVIPVIGGKGFHRQRMEGKMCFELWVDRGTLQKAASAMYHEKGVTNRKGKPYSASGLARSAKRYVLFNQEDARKIWEEKYWIISDKLWYDYVIRIKPLLLVMGRGKLQEWEKDNPEIMEYERSSQNGS